MAGRICVVSGRPVTESANVADWRGLALPGIAPGLTAS